MSDGNRTCCVGESGWLGNDVFNTLMSAVVKRDKGSSQQLFLAVAPLLVAFYAGQVQARRLDGGDVKQLVRQTLMEVHRQRASRDPCRPFRAWLLDMARLQMAGYQRGRGGRVVMEPQVASEVDRLLDALWPPVARNTRAGPMESPAVPNWMAVMESKERASESLQVTT